MLFSSPIFADTSFWKAERKIITIYEAVRDSVPWDVICVRTKHTVSIHCEWFMVFAKNFFYSQSCQHNTLIAASRLFFASTVPPPRCLQVLTSTHRAAPMMAIVSGPIPARLYL